MIYPRNARPHSNKQIGQIADSIKEFGFTNPVLIDGKNQIIVGHGRMEAAKLIGMTDVPTLQFDCLTEAEKFKCAEEFRKADPTLDHDESIRRAEAERRDWLIGD